MASTRAIALPGIRSHLLAGLLVLAGAACSGGVPPTGGSAAEGVGVPVFPITNRPDVMGRELAVSSDHPLASAAGMEVLLRGGNAVDAAVTMAGVLAVVRPHMNGVGGDAFALIRDGRTGAVRALNGSGRAGALATPGFFRSAGDSTVPSRGFRSVSIPGAVGAWEEALEQYGTLSMAQALAPAIRLAEGGFPVSQRLHDDIAGAARALDQTASALYLPGGSPPPVGTLLKNPALGATLRLLGVQGARAMYGGPLGERLAAFVAEGGGHLTPDDFRTHTTDWEEPLEVDYLGYRVLGMLPPTQGITLLQQMRLADALGGMAGLEHNSSEYLHRMVAIKELAFADRDRWVADPAFAPAPLERLLDPAYAAERAGVVESGRALVDVESGIPLPAGAGQQAGSTAEAGGEVGERDGGDTVYLTVVDAQGNAVSWIQSLFASFGSGILEPETGIVLHNRGALYVLDEGHPQVVAPGKRPFHTLTPHMVLRGDELAFTFGTPGGDSQTQTLLQVMHNMELFGMSPQAAVEAPRYRSERELLLEDRIPGISVQGLEAMGYLPEVSSGWTATFGGVQVIRVHPESGVRIVASDPRREAYGLAW